jgi:hypothetical protein
MWWGVPGWIFAVRALIFLLLVILLAIRFRERWTPELRVVPLLAVRISLSFPETLRRLKASSWMSEEILSTLDGSPSSPNLAVMISPLVREDEDARLEQADGFDDLFLLWGEGGRTQGLFLVHPLSESTGPMALFLHRKSLMGLLRSLSDRSGMSIEELPEEEAWRLWEQLQRGRLGEQARAVVHAVERSASSLPSPRFAAIAALAGMGSLAAILFATGELVDFDFLRGFILVGQLTAIASGLAFLSGRASAVMWRGMGSSGPTAWGRGRDLKALPRWVVFGSAAAAPASWIVFWMTAGAGAAISLIAMTALLVAWVVGMGTIGASFSSRPAPRPPKSDPSEAR